MARRPVTPEAAGSSPVDPANFRSRSHCRKVVSPKPRSSPKGGGGAKADRQSPSNITVLPFGDGCHVRYVTANFEVNYGRRVEEVAEMTVVGTSTGFIDGAFGRRTNRSSADQEVVAPTLTACADAGEPGAASDDESRAVDAAVPIDAPRESRSAT